MIFNKRHNREIGSLGEDWAVEYLTGKGYRILERNYKLFCGEIDILAKDKGTIVIVEVKTVRGRDFGLAQELVRFKKQNKLRLLGRAIEQKYPSSPVRIDVIGIQYEWEEPRIEHIQNAVI